MSEQRPEPIRLAFFSDAPWVGGAERYLQLLAANLPPGRFVPHLLVDDASRLGTLVSWMQELGVHVREVPIDLLSGRGYRTFMGEIRALAIDVLHCNMPGPWGAQYGLVAPLAKLAGARAVVATEHLPMIPPFAKGAVLKRIGSAFIDRVMTVSEDNVGWLRRYHRVPLRKIRVVRIGVPEPPASEPAAGRAALGFAAGDFVCLIAASLEARKGHRFAIEALARLSPAVKLVVAGAGDEEGACRRLSRDLGLEGRVRFLGFQDDVQALLAASDALIVPSLLEATPYVIVEAMAAARAVVATRIFGIPELVIEGETGILVEPGGAEDLARAIGALERDRALAARLGAAGRARYERAFRIERCVAETVAVYSEAMRTG